MERHSVAHSRVAGRHLRMALDLVIGVHPPCRFCSIAIGAGEAAKSAPLTNLNPVAYSLQRAVHLTMGWSGRER